MRKDIIIADILSGVTEGKRVGHYFSLARNYRAIFGENLKVAGGPVYNTAFQHHDLYPLPYNVTIGGNALINRLKTFANARALFKKAKGKIVILQQCTTITTFVCVLLFYRRDSKLFLIQYSLEGFRMKAGSLLYKLVKNKFNGLICPNKEVGDAYGIPYCVVPDYIYSGKAQISSNYKEDYKAKKFDFCVIGRLSEEKGAVEVAKSFVGSNYKLIIAGMPESEELNNTLHLLCDYADNIKLITGYLTDEEFERYLCGSRFAILNYQGEYSNRSSGVVYDTLFSGIPVVGRRCKALQFIEDNEAGYLYENIADFNPEKVLNEETYCFYRNNIKMYCNTHKQYKEKLISFVNKE